MSVSSAAKEAMGFTGKPMLESVASEVKDHIFSFLPQKSLYHLLLTGPALSEDAAIALYHSPKFRTTYRFAQFVTSVSHSSRYANMVRVFELSDRKESENRLDLLASWREWQYRDRPLYRAQAPPTVPNRYKGNHPVMNCFFNRTNLSLPIGSVVHVLAACRNIRSRSSPVRFAMIC